MQAVCVVELDGDDLACNRKDTQHLGGARVTGGDVGGLEVVGKRRGVDEVVSDDVEAVVSCDESVRAVDLVKEVFLNRLH